MTHSYKTLWKYVKHKPSYNLLLVHLNGGFPVPMPVVFGREGCIVASDINDSMVADGDFVQVERGSS